MHRTSTLTEGRQSDSVVPCLVRLPDAASIDESSVTILWQFGRQIDQLTRS
jgi:hypothetical protein